MLATTAFLCLSAALSSAAVVHRASETATIAIPQATILGNVKDSIESFSGIPYAEPPIGPLRLKPPQRLNRSLGVFDGIGPAGACPQFVSSPESSNFLESILGSVVNLPFVHTVSGQSEDCLTITVARPAGTRTDAKLPVLYWIFGGAFELGWSSMYDGTSLVNFGVTIDRPFIFVAINYRVGGFGFLAGKEILADGSANLGLLDQRMGLEWVADNIAHFGGDPDQVTIAGESAGAISVLDQMALYGGDHKYKGKPLFRGGIMSSGSIIPAEPIDSDRAQAVYDQVVLAGGCAGQADTLECLRGLDYADFVNAVSAPPGLLSYSGLALSYLPRPDGHILPDSPDVLIREGKYARVPFISNLTSKDALVEYLHHVVFKSASEDQLSELVDTYHTGIAALVEGSPFRTGVLNDIFPGFKRRAALLGDVLFTLSRRAFLELANEANPSVPSWSYLATYDYGTPVLGTFHGSDLLQVFYGIFDDYAAKATRTYFINFVHSLDPNGDRTGTLPEWQPWAKGKQLINFAKDKATHLADDFRSDSYEVIKKLGGVLRL
ncbi:Alpha/Beta hydrolase protein [Aspergillus pseudoustus]|uniref:Carboxylic ester hydrolase n=1 Tax=Aspergillus pseudoustus TaxID=1810923 RepID=A0ABR4JXV3_9EURO